VNKLQTTKDRRKITVVADKTQTNKSIK
jgi:hypothetical protein